MIRLGWQGWPLTAASLYGCIGALAVLAACHKDAPTNSKLSTASEHRGPLVVADQPKLPEDPAAGKRSQEQWRRHMQAEEIERQMIFDRYRLKEHHALIARINTARERLDDTKTPPDLERARKQLAPALTEIKAAVDAIDRWKNSSHLLSDYDALVAALSGSYADARRAAMGGDTQPLARARADFDAHLRNMHAWLRRVDSDEDSETEEGN